MAAGDIFLQLYDEYICGYVDNAIDLGHTDKEFKNLYLDGLAYIDGFGEDTDMGDFDIHSLDGLFGFDDNVFIDMGADGRIIIQADGAGTPFSTPDIDITGSTYFDDDMGFLLGKKILFGDAAVGIYSQADTFLDVFADGGLRIGDSSAGAPTNYSKFAADGELTLAGTARVKQEFAVGAESFAPGSTGADSVVLNNYSGWSFDIGDDMIMSFEVPYDCDVSEDLKVEVYWYINEAYGAGAQVKWQIVYACCPADETEAIDAPTHSDTVTFADKNIPATAKFLTDNSALIPAASVAQDDLISINLERIAADGTDPTADPVVVRVEIEYTKNKLGEPT